MSLPPLYNDAIKLFLEVQGKENIYISNSLETTEDQEDKISYEMVSGLAKIAIDGLKQQILEQSESYEKLQSQAIAVRDYLIKVKENPEVHEIIHQIFIDLFMEVEVEIKQLAANPDFIDEQGLKILYMLSKLAKDEEIQIHLKFQEFGIRDDKTKIRLAKIVIEQGSTTQILEFIQNWGIKNQEALIEIAKFVARKDGYGISLFILNFGIKDQEALIEIAELSAQQNGEMTSRYIKNYGIENEEALTLIARLAAIQNGKGTSEYIQNYGIKNRKHLIAIAKKVAENDGEGISRYIQNYGIGNKGFLHETRQWAFQQIGWGTTEVQTDGIDEQRELIEIAKLAAQQNGEMTSRYIQNYGINDQYSLTYILKEAALQNDDTFKYIQNYGIKNQETLIQFAMSSSVSTISGYIHYFGIKDERALIDIAKLSIQESVGWTSRHIKNYGIKNQQALDEIALLGAERHPGTISEYIQNYGIKNEELLIKIAKLAAKHSGDLTSRYIQNYGIKDQKILIEIAVIAAVQNGSLTSSYIQNYGIKDPKVLIEIAKHAARSDGNTSRFIKKYGIKDQKTLVEIAKLAAQENGDATSLSINDYGIQNQEDLIEIAKIGVQHDTYGAVSGYIKNFGIKSQSALIEIAKLAAQKSGRGISLHIKEYGITNKNALIEIAKLAAENNGGVVTCHIQNYGIDDQNALIEIAKIAARQNAEGTSENIQNYGIKDQEALIEIARSAAQQTVMVSKHIHNYGIKDERILIEIAKFCFSGWFTSEYIQNYGITDQQALTEIAKRSAQQHGLGTSLFIKNYGIQDEETLFEIAKLAAQQNGDGTSQYINNYGIQNETHRLQVFFIAFKNDPKSIKNIDKYDLSFPRGVLYDLSEKSSFSLGDLQEIFQWPEEFSPIFKAFSQEAPKKEDILFLIYVGCRFLKKSPFIKDLNLWGSILQHRDHKMRYELVDMIFALDETQAKIYTEVSKPDHLQLPALFYCFSSQNFEEAKRYHVILKDKKEFRDVKTYGMMQKALLDVLQPLIVQHHFNIEEVITLLKKALEGNIKAKLFSIQGTLNCGGVDRLRKEAQKENPDLDAAYQAAFAQAIPIKPIKDFSTKYEQSFGRCALPSAPLTYAGKLRQLPKDEQEKALPALGSFIYSVLEGEYPEIRYKRLRTSDKESETKVLAHLDHLQKIFDYKPSLKKEWPIEIDQVPLENYLSTPGKISFDPRSFLDETIIRQKHLSRDRYPLLFQYLENIDPVKEKVLMENFQKLLKDFAEQKKEEAAQKINLRNALASLNEFDKTDKIEKKEKTEKPEDIAKRNKIKAGRLLRVLTTAKKQLEGLREISESLKDIEKLDPSDPNYLSKVKIYVDRFKKAGATSPTQLTADDEEQQRLLLLQKDLIDLYRSEAPLKQLLNQLIKIQGKFGQSREEFVNDVQGKIKALQMQRQTYEDFTLTNTDRFDFMLLCGTQVLGSCQRIDGDPRLNKCLLAYLLDGKNRLIAIKDKEGNIVARSILRLLWDKTGNSPVLMQERVYSNIADDNLTVALDKFAKAQSERLGLPLYRYDGTGTANLESFGSNAPWEYVDSANGVHANGKFTITKASVVDVATSFLVAH